MDYAEKNAQIIEKQFQELIDKAKLLYPNIDESFATMDNMIANTTILNEFLNLSVKTPHETSTNQTTFI